MVQVQPMRNNSLELEVELQGFEVSSRTRSQNRELLQKTCDHLTARAVKRTLLATSAQKFHFISSQCDDRNFGILLAIFSQTSSILRKAKIYSEKQRVQSKWYLRYIVKMKLTSEYEFLPTMCHLFPIFSFQDVVKHQRTSAITNKISKSS